MVTTTGEDKEQKGLVPDTGNKCPEVNQDEGHQGLDASIDNGVGRQDRHRTINKLLRHLPDGCSGVFWRKGRIIQVDLTYQGLNHLVEVQEWIGQFEPCIVMLSMDMGTFTSHFVGAYVNGEYCTSGVSSYVYDLMLSCCRQ